MVHLSGLGLSSELMVLGLGGSLVQDWDRWLVVRTPSNPGFWWGNFLVLPEPVQPGRGETWLQRFAEAFPGATHRAFAVDGPTGKAGDPGELAAMGVEVTTDTVLTAPVAGLAAPPPSARRAASLRALAGDGDWAQALALRIASDDMTMTPEYHAYLTRKVADERAVTEAGHGARFGAFSDGVLVADLGIVSDRRGLARYQGVRTHPAHRRRGLCRALLAMAGEHAGAELGAHTLVILADPGYHAIDLYRSAGFTDTEVHVQLQQPAP